MNKNKLLIIISVSVVALVAVIMIFVNGINIGVSGVVSFTTKYYKTPEEACEHFEPQPLEISESVDFIQIDDHNGMFIGTTAGGETEGYIFVSMQTKNKKYFCSGFYSIVEYSQISDDTSRQGNTIFLYNDGGWCRGQCEYMIIYDEKELQQLDDSYKTQYITSKSGSGFYFVFRTIQSD